MAVYTEHVNCFCTSPFLSCNTFLYKYILSHFDLSLLPIICCSTVDPFCLFIKFVLFSALELPASQQAYFHSLFTIFFTCSISHLFIRPSLFPVTTPRVLRIFLSPVGDRFPPGLSPSLQTYASLCATQENGLVLINSLWGCLREPHRRRCRDACRWKKERINCVVPL